MNVQEQAIREQREREITAELEQLHDVHDLDSGWMGAPDFTVYSLEQLYPFQAKLEKRIDLLFELEMLRYRPAKRGKWRSCCGCPCADELEMLRQVRDAIISKKAALTAENGEEPRGTTQSTGEG